MSGPEDRDPPEGPGFVRAGSIGPRAWLGALRDWWRTPRRTGTPSPANIKASVSLLKGNPWPDEYPGLLETLAASCNGDVPVLFGRDGECQGWVRAMSVHGDELRATVELTPRGVELVKENPRARLSPEILLSPRDERGALQPPRIVIVRSIELREPLQAGWLGSGKPVELPRR